MRSRAKRTLGPLLVMLALSSIIAIPSRVHAWASDEEEEPAPAPTATASISPSSFAGMVGLPSIVRGSKSLDGKTRAAAVARAAEIGGDDAWKIVEAGASDAIGDDADGALMVRLAAARALVSDPRKSQATAALKTLFSTPIPQMKSPAPVNTWGGGWGPGGWTPPIPQPAAKPIKRADPDLVRLVRETAERARAPHGLALSLVGRNGAHGHGARLG